MELPGSGYFQTLALFSVTFGGFAVFVAVFRQMIGGRLSDFRHVFHSQYLIAQLHGRWLQHASFIAGIVRNFSFYNLARIQSDYRSSADPIYFDMVRGRRAASDTPY